MSYRDDQFDIKQTPNPHSSTTLDPHTTPTGHYRPGMVNLKSFVGKDLLRIKWNFELTVHF